MKVKIIVRKQRNGGRDYYYPVNAGAKNLAKLIRRKTFTLADIKLVTLVLETYNVTVAFEVEGVEPERIAV